MSTAAVESPAATKDAGSILEDVVALIGADVGRIRTLVSKADRVLTGEEARILAGYARALVDVARARKAAEDDELTPEEEAALEQIQKIPQVREMLSRAEATR